MDSRILRKQHLHGPWPSPIEELQARYAADWEIYRDLLPEGKHGDWIAKHLRPGQRGTSEVRAGSVESLAQQLEAAREEHGDA